MARLLASFPEKGGSGAARAEAYMLAAEKLPLRSLAEAVERYCTGLVDGQSKAFVPSTAELCAEVRRLETLAAYLARKRAEPKPEPKPEPKALPKPISDEDRAATLDRIRAKFPGALKPFPTGN